MIEKIKVSLYKDAINHTTIIWQKWSFYLGGQAGSYKLRISISQFFLIRYASWLPGSYRCIDLGK